MPQSAIPATTSMPATSTSSNNDNNTSKTSNASTSTPSNGSDAIPPWVAPNLSRLLRVEHNPGSFTSRSTSLVDLPPGALFARITTATPSAPAYSTVQASRDLHVELNSDLLYTNHSCRPSLVFDMERWEVRVAERRPRQDGRMESRGLKSGDELTFFYPSTEWDMAQSFECTCGAEECCGWIRGAKDMEGEVLGRYWLNGHVEKMLVEQRGVNWKKA